MANQPPVCKKNCGHAHWPFQPCPQREPTPPGEVVWPAPPEGYREFSGAPDMLSDSLARSGFGVNAPGFGAPALVGFTRPRKRA